MQTKKERVFKPIYNEEIKNRFLDKYKEGGNKTYLYYRRVFEKSYDYEVMKGYDLFDFNILEIEQILKDLNPLTAQASETNGRVITAYIDWSIKPQSRSGKRTEDNPLSDKHSKYFAGLIDKNRKIYFTDKEIYAICEECENAQDAVIIRLLFEGVNGRELSEISNLEKYDINWDTRELTVYETLGYDAEGFPVRAEPRIVQVSELCLQYLKEAINQYDYVKRNGYMEENGNITPYTNLVKNDFVIRASITKTRSYDNYSETSFDMPVDVQVMHRRIKTVARTTERDYLVAKNIFRSGVIYHLKQRYDMNNGKLTMQDYKDVAKIFNISFAYSIKKFCTEETIEKLYNINKKQAVSV